VHGPRARLGDGDRFTRSARSMWEPHSEKRAGKNRTDKICVLSGAGVTTRAPRGSDNVAASQASMRGQEG
jgi:hypothetical protein